VQALPSQQFLDDVAAFQLTQFTSPRVRVLANAIDAGADPLPDPDPIVSPCPRPVDPLGRWNFAPCPTRPTGSTSTGNRRPKSVRHCWRI
jgi:hypothetical protein